VVSGFGSIGLRQIDHFAIAVRDLEAAYRLFGATFGGTFMTGGDDAERDIRTVQLNVPPGIRIELMQPLSTDSYLAHFIERHGEGFHHMTFFVEQLEPAIKSLVEEGYELVDTKLDRVGWRETYLRPASGFGTLIQVVETTTDWGQPTSAFDLDDVFAGRVYWTAGVARLRQAGTG